METAPLDKLNGTLGPGRATEAKGTGVDDSHHPPDPTRAAWQGEWLWEEHRGTELCGRLAGEQRSLRSPRAHRLVISYWEGDLD